MVELVVVMAVIGVVIAIAVPNFLRMTESRQFDNEYRQLRSSFTDCRARAIDVSRPAGRPVALEVRADGIDCFVWDSLNDAVEEDIFSRDFERARVNFGLSDLPDDRMLLVSNGGYFLTTTRTTTVARLWVEDEESEEPAWFEVFPSGQMRGL